MTALAADTIIQQRGPEPDIRSYLVADNVLIYKGAIVCLDTNGYANVGANTASFKTLGIALEHIDNTIAGHTAGGQRVRVISGVDFLLTSSGLAQSNVGAPVYVADSGSVGLTETNSVKAGAIREYVSATQAWVQIPVPGSASGSF